jgi:GNAT superfamily N-acetyltransferase
MAERFISKNGLTQEEEGTESRHREVSRDDRSSLGVQAKATDFFSPLFDKDGSIIAQSAERFVEKIKSFDRDDFNKFLTNLEGDPNRDDLPQHIVDVIMDKGMSLIRGRDPIEAKNDPLTRNLNDAVQPNGNYKRKNPSGLSLTDKAYKALLELWQKYPAQAEGFFVFMGRDPETIRPDVYIKGAVDFMWRPDMPSAFQSNILESLAYLYSFEEEVYERYIFENFDFMNKDNYFKTATLLEFVNDLLRLVRDYGYSESAKDSLVRLLERVTDENRGSYLLNMRARLMLKDFYWEKDRDSLKPKNMYPVLVAPGIYGRISHEGIFVSSPGDEGEIKRKIIRSTAIKEEMFKNPSLRIMQTEIDGGLIPVFPDPASAESQAFREWRESVEEINSLLNHKISFKDVAPFSSRGGTEASEEVAKDMFDFQYLVSDDVRNIIADDFHFNLANIPLQEQFYFLQFIKHKEAREIDPVKNFVKSYGLPGLRTFLSLDYGKDLGDKIVALGNSLDHEAASAIFSKYGQIVDAVEAVRAYLGANFHQEETLTPEIVAKITDNLLRRGRDLLAHFADQTQEAKNGRKVLDPGNILDELQEIKTETLLFLSSFQTLKREGVDLDFAAIQDLDFGSMPARSLSLKDVSEMKAMYEKNYADNVEIRDDLLSVFAQAVTRENTVFYVLRYQGKIIGFVRFDDKGDGRLYAGSLNVHPRFRGSAIGEVVMEKTIDLKARVAILDADSSAIDSVGAHYIEAGFVANSFYDYKGDPSFKMERNDRVRYESKLMSKSDIVERYNHRSVDDRDMIITSSSAKDPVRLRFNLLNEGYLLTRYFQYPNGVKNAPWYCVFEPAVANHNVSAKTQAA